MKTFRILAMVTGLLAWSAPVIAQEQCAEPSSSESIREHMSKAWVAYAALEIDTFMELTSTLEAQVGCANEPLSAAEAAGVHRLLGVRAFGERDIEGASRFFAAARSVDPQYTLPPDAIPAHHPVHDAYKAISVDTLSSIALAPAKKGTLHINGVPSTTRIEGLPTIFQFVSDRGEVDPSILLAVDDAVPAYPSGRTQAVATARSPSSSPRINVPLAATTGAAVVATGVFYAMGSSARSNYYADDASLDDLDRLRSRTNTMAVASTLTGAVALGAGVGVAMTSDW